MIWLTLPPASAVGSVNIPKIGLFVNAKTRIFASFYRLFCGEKSSIHRYSVK